MDFQTRTLNALAFDYFWAYSVALVVHPMLNFLPLRAREMKFLRFGYPKNQKFSPGVAPPDPPHIMGKGQTKNMEVSSRGVLARGTQPIIKSFPAKRVVFLVFCKHQQKTHA